MTSSSMKRNIVFLSLFACIFAIGIIYVDGCGSDTTTNTPTQIDNPNVKSFDSVNVQEDSALSNFSTINLLVGTNGLWNNGDRDASLYSPYNPPTDTTYSNFYLRTGTLLNKFAGGYETKFFLVRSDMSQAEFDTMSAVTSNIGTALDTTDFTQDNTYGTPSDPWGYFNAPLNTHPVYCFWLQGKKDGGITPKNVFGILQPREATDSQPNHAYGFRISFRIRINTNGENDFRKKINQ